MVKKYDSQNFTHLGFLQPSLGTSWNLKTAAFPNFALFSSIGAMILLISCEQIKLESYACAQIEALEEGNRWLYLDDAGDPSEWGRNAANMISGGGGGLFCPFFSNWCHGFANISCTNQAKKLRLHSNWSSWRGEWLLILRWCRGSLRVRKKCAKRD